MWLIIILVIVGALLLVAELILLPGLSVAGICALIAYGGAVYLGFERYDMTGGIIVIVTVIVLSLVATWLSLRAKTWQRLALNEKIESRSQELPSEKLALGQRGTAVTRLAPGGKINIAGETFEARTFGNTYVDPRCEVQVVDFENFTVIVAPVRADETVCEETEI